MGRKKVGRRDQRDNNVDSSSVVDKSLILDDIKTTGGVDNVSGATLSYDGVTDTPTLKTVIDGIIAGTGFTFDAHVSSAATDYVMSGSRQIDVTKLLLVIYNGQVLRKGASFDYEIVTTSLADDTVQFKFTPENGYEIYVVFEALP